MFVEDVTMIIRKGVLSNIARIFFEGRLLEKIDRVPLQMYPKKSSIFTCCTYKDRAIVKYRCMAALGIGVEQEADELTSLSQHAAAALGRNEPQEPFLTVIDAACSACVQSRYEVTSICRLCSARFCLSVCPRSAIAIENKRAVINPDKCLSCGKCATTCPYHAIVRIPLPCEEACPVSALSKDGDGKVQIDHGKCILCGKCANACPFGAIMEKSEVLDVLKRLADPGATTVAMVAPAVAGQFGDDYGRLLTALRELGFDDVIEVALGADVTAGHETREFIERMQGGEKFMATSCCPAWVEAVGRHYPEVRPFVSTALSPMRYTGEIAKRERPGAFTVFIGPCMAKRREALADENVDFVLTFEELDALFMAKDISVPLCDPAPVTRAGRPDSRGFPLFGGVTRALKNALGDAAQLKPIEINGLSQKQLRLVKAYAMKNCPGNFIEVMSCEGGCIAGPKIVVSPSEGTKAVEKLAAQTD